jgi:hypothetical protein
MTKAAPALILVTGDSDAGEWRVQGEPEPTARSCSPPAHQNKRKREGGRKRRRERERWGEGGREKEGREGKEKKHTNKTPPTNFITSDAPRRSKIQPHCLAKIASETQSNYPFRTKKFKRLHCSSTFNCDFRRQGFSLGFSFSISLQKCSEKTEGIVQPMPAHSVANALPLCTSSLSTAYW